MSDGMTDARRMEDEGKKEDERLRSQLAEQDPDGCRRQRARDAFIELEAALKELPDNRNVSDVARLVDEAQKRFIYNVGTKMGNRFFSF